MATLLSQSGKRPRGDDDDDDDNNKKIKANPSLSEMALKNVTFNIGKYLDCDVDAVTLPEILDAAIENTYPPLILDGASGVGKTQQAFALLKKEKCLVYLLLSSLSQDIYKEMNYLCKFQEFNDMYDGYVKSLDTKKTDLFSMDELEQKLVKGHLNGFLRWFARSTLFYSMQQNRDGTTKHVLLQKQRVAEDTGTLQNELMHRVLFIDEALPHNCEQKDKDRLRFVRNLGRILMMRVVPAGTAAVAANMFDENTGVSESRVASSRQNPIRSSRWAMCTFLWKPMKENELEKVIDEGRLNLQIALPDLEKNALKSALLLERPLFILRLLDLLNAEERVDIVEILKLIGRDLCQNKRLDKDFKLKTLWLSGAWLAKRSNWTSSQYRIKAPQLVCGHFFEPAIMATEEKIPFLGNGSTKLTSLPGPLEVTIYHFKKEHTNEKVPMWILSTKCKVEDHPGQAYLKEDDSNNNLGGAVAAATADFDNIKEALSICVQQCLGREPLLAIALSQQHRFSKEDFKQGIKCFRESLADQSLSAINGKQLELIVFAALQLSNGDNMNEPASFDAFCDNLADYLSPDYTKEEEKKESLMFGHIRKRFRCPKISHLPNGYRKSNTEYDCAHAKKRLKKVNGVRVSDGNPSSNVKIPWLVPAHSSKDIKCSQAHRTLFAEKEIAALVPASTNECCDIDAYRWPPPSENGDPELLWKFEVKGRSGDYSMTQGIDALIAKCGDHDSERGRHHAMLIAVRGQWVTEKLVWQVEKGGKIYLRVVILVCGR